MNTQKVPSQVPAPLLVDTLIAWYQSFVTIGQYIGYVETVRSK